MISLIISIITGIPVICGCIFIIVRFPDYCTRSKKEGKRNPAHITSSIPVRKLLEMSSSPTPSLINIISIMIEDDIGKITQGIKLLSPPPLSDKEKERIIKKALKTQKGRDELVKAMTRPICESLDYARIGQHLLMDDNIEIYNEFLPPELQEQK